MSEISKLMWQTMEVHIKSMIENACNEYEKNPLFHIKKFYEHGELKGFCIFHDDNGTRYLDEGHYIGTNNFIALRMWNWARKGANKFSATVQKTNERVWKTYQNRGFKIVREDVNNFYLMRGD